MCPTKPREYISATFLQTDQQRKEAQFNPGKRIIKQGTDMKEKKLWQETGADILPQAAPKEIMKHDRLI